MPANEQFLRNPKRMHRVFCATVLVFAGATLLLLYADHKDEWRGYQRQFYKYQARLLENERAKFLTDNKTDAQSFKSSIEELEGKIESLDRELATTSDVYNDQAKAVKDLIRDNELQASAVRSERANRDVAAANVDLAIRDVVSADVLQTKQATFETKRDSVIAMEQEWERRIAALKAAQKKLSETTSDRDKLRDERKKRTAEMTRIEESLSEIAPGSGFKKFKRAFMELPIIDGFNGHLEVKQDWLPDLHIRLGMTTTARFDRCRTCHLGIDQFAAGNVPVFPAGNGEGEYGQPFSSHPQPGLYLTATSPHPIATFGCTSCHEGAGSATSFLNAQHGANDPHQDHEWNKKYGHFHNHFWEYPMLPERLRDAACIKCHHSVVELGVSEKFGASAPKAYEGWQLIREYGCFGCHEINGFDGKSRIGPDLRLEPTEEEEPKYAADPNLTRGQMRKVGPSLKHVSQKVSQSWLAYWTQEPKRFRPDTRMPQFFGVTPASHDDVGQKLSEVELAGLAKFLAKQSTPVAQLTPKAGYQPNAERGKQFFGEKGCLACHSYNQPEFAAVKADFGPDLSKIHEKLLPGEAGFNWLYSWIRNPQAHHPRTRMPNLYLDPFEVEGTWTEPAADIAAFLLQKPSVETATPQFDKKALLSLVEEYLSGKTLTSDQYQEFLTSHKYPIDPKLVKGDEVELLGNAEAESSEESWNERLLLYVGRRSISRYGCYGCHDINGFGGGRPIGTGLNDWGRKDTGRLALEHIEEYLHHHGERDGSSTAKYVADTLKKANSNGFDSPEQREEGLRTAFFFESLQHHGRPGFIFQKLRDPRSYDYEKLSRKKYTERLVMPRFPLTDGEIEAVATFVLGLVADPPATKYVYNPAGAKRDRNEGEILLQKFNCGGCHMLDLHKFEYSVDEGELAASELQATEHPAGRDALLNWRKPVAAYTGRSRTVEGKSLATVSLRGIPAALPDPTEAPEDQVLSFDSWEPVALLSASEIEERGKKGEPIKAEEVLLPGSRVVVPGPKLVRHVPSRGGRFGEWLVGHLAETKYENNRNAAWQRTPPPLYREGEKVQTPWLYRFLKDPKQIRHTIELRMPRFNMSDDEARTLANYFAANDGAAYPYQSSELSADTYLENRQEGYRAAHADRAKNQPYLDEAWQMLTTTLCIKCHAVGGRPFKAAPNDKNVTRGPNLDAVSTRLRPEWVEVWLYNPKWITPYTAMPLPFPNGKGEKPIFDGEAGDQTRGVRDALYNYHYLLERHATTGKLAADNVPAAPVEGAK